ncbi:sigma-70 family RNA polymerase sigma factor [Patescibacteria group bacterium]|nr:sigma-70 family RNA polymerase sigma factor [Patescibacteria group bacterium]
MVDKNDHDLVNGLKANDTGYQKLLVDKYAGYLLPIVMRLGLCREDGLEVINDTFYKVVQNINQFDLTRGTKFSAWIAKIAIYTARDKYKQQKDPPISQSIDERAERGIQDTEKVWQEKQPAGTKIGQLSQKIMRQAMENLSNTDKDILRLRVCGFEHKEIAVLLDKTPDAVKVAYLRAKERLKQKYISILETFEDKHTATEIKAFLHIEDDNEKAAN